MEGASGGSLQDEDKEKKKTAAEIRKANKPLMERRRRERINTCLEQLKALLMDVTNKESSYYSKLEKADILELTVKYLKSLKRQQRAALAICEGSGSGDKYAAGFSECTHEVATYLSSVEGLNADSRSRLVSHLNLCLNKTAAAVPGGASSSSTSINTSLLTRVEESTAESPTAVAMSSKPLSQVVPQISIAQPLQVQTPSFTPAVSSSFCIIGSLSTQHVQPIQPLAQSAIPIQLVPARLATGETVFVLANPQQQQQSINLFATQTGCVTTSMQFGSSHEQLSIGDGGHRVVHVLPSCAEITNSSSQLSSTAVISNCKAEQSPDTSGCCSDGEGPSVKSCSISSSGYSSFLSGYGETSTREEPIEPCASKSSIDYAETISKQSRIHLDNTECVSSSQNGSHNRHSSSTKSSNVSTISKPPSPDSSVLLSPKNIFHQKTQEVRLVSAQMNENPGTTWRPW